MLFRTEVGAGLIKLRHDRCWRRPDLPLLPLRDAAFAQSAELVFSSAFPGRCIGFQPLVSHFVQVAAPFALLAPQPFAAIAGGLIIFHQLGF